MPSVDDEGAAVECGLDWTDACAEKFDKGSALFDRGYANERFYVRSLC